jgi:hypothetical protein
MERTRPFRAQAMAQSLNNLSLIGPGDSKSRVAALTMNGHQKTSIVYTRRIDRVQPQK